MIERCYSLFLIFLFVSIVHGSGWSINDTDPLPANITPCSVSNATVVCGVSSICLNDSQVYPTAICYCKNDSYCGSISLVCQGHDFCGHKDLWKVNYLDIITGFLLLFISALAAASGTGGGGILVALYIAIENFPASKSIPLSKATILGGAVANALYNFFQRHPEADRPLIDYNLVGFLEPGVLLGTVLGVYLVKLLPSWIVLILLVIVLTYVAYKTFTKGLKLWREEKKSANKPITQTNADRQSLLVTGGGYIRDSFAEDSDTVNMKPLLMNEEMPSMAINNSIESDEVSLILENDKNTPWAKLASFLIIWGGIFAIAFLKGGEGQKSPVGLACGSWQYWIVVCSTIPLVVIYLGVFGYFVKKEYDHRVQVGFPFLDSDIRYTTPMLVKLPFYCVCAGVAAGLFGIGSGMIINPILLEMNVPPRVSSAVSAFMILFTASSTTIQFAVLGMLKYDYAIYFSILGFFGALSGQFGVSFLLKKYNKTSIVVFALFIIIVAGAVALAVMGILKLVDDFKDGVKLWELSPLCGPEEK